MGTTPVSPFPSYLHYVPTGYMVASVLSVTTRVRMIPISTPKASDIGLYKSGFLQCVINLLRFLDFSSSTTSNHQQWRLLPSSPYLSRPLLPDLSTSSKISITFFLNGARRLSRTAMSLPLQFSVSYYFFFTIYCFLFTEISSTIFDY